MYCISSQHSPALRHEATDMGNTLERTASQIAAVIGRAVRDDGILLDSSDHEGTLCKLESFRLVTVFHEEKALSISYLTMAPVKTALKESQTLLGLRL